MSGLSAAIVGPGNIGTDLLIKLLRGDRIRVHSMVGVDPESEGPARARKLGSGRSTSPPAAIGPFVCPPVNLDEPADAPDLNMITCGGQATIPIVHAVSSVAPVPYAEIVASIASRSAGPGTRANIDEFTRTTARAIESVGGAGRGTAIVILNPVDPPMIMRDTVFCAIPPDADTDAIAASVHAMVERVAAYVPGYTLRAEPQFDRPRDVWNGHARVAVFLEVRGNGDHLPPWAGNLDIMTAAAAGVGERLAERHAKENAR